MTDTNIVLYVTDNCPYCNRVYAAFADLDLKYEIVNVPADHGKRGAVKALFGATGVPSMTDGDVKIADDDDAIVAYAREKYGKQ
jgi:glutathione S-transferase